MAAADLNPADVAAAAAAPTVFRELPAQPNRQSSNIEPLADVELTVRVELGRALMRLDDVLALDEGAVVELDRAAGDDVDVYVNDRLVARGEVVVLDGKFGVRLAEVVSPGKDE